MGSPPDRGDPRTLQRPRRVALSVGSGRALLAATLVLVLCDVVGGFIALASGADSWQESWGFDTDTAVPLPVGLVQLALAWLAARDVRPPVGLVAAVILSLFCLTSVLFGLFDGDLAGNVATDGLTSWGVLWGVVLLVVTGVVGVLAQVGRGCCTDFVTPGRRPA